MTRNKKAAAGYYELVLLLPLFIIPVLFLPDNKSAFNLPKFLALKAAAAFAAAAAAYLYFTAPRGTFAKSLKATGVTIAAMAVALACAVSSVNSPATQLFNERFCDATAAFIFGSAAIALARAGAVDAERVFAALPWAAAAPVLYAAIQAAGLDPLSWNLERGAINPLFSTAGNINLFAMFMNACLPGAIFITAGAGGNVQAPARAAAGILVFSNIFFTYLTFNKLPIAVCAFAAAISAAMAFGRRKDAAYADGLPDGKRGRDSSSAEADHKTAGDSSASFSTISRRPAAAFVIFLAAAAALIAIFDMGSVIFSKDGSLAAWTRNTINASVDSRRLSFTAAIDIWKTSPLTGTGFGSYRYLSSAAMADIFKRPEGEKLAGHAGAAADTHNDLLQMLCECGILGAAAFLFLWGAIFKGLLRGVRDGRPCATAAIISFATIVINSMTSFPFANPIMLMTVALCAVLADSYSAVARPTEDARPGLAVEAGAAGKASAGAKPAGDNDGGSRSFNRLLAASLAAASIYSIFGIYFEGLPRLVSDRQLNYANRALAAGGTKEAFNRLVDSLTAYEHNGEALFLLSSVYFLTGFDEDGARYLRDAKKYMDDAVIHQSEGYYHYKKARIHEAMACLGRAASYSPAKPTAAAPLNLAGKCAIIAGFSEKARRELTKAVYVNPHFIEARLNLAELLLASGDPAGAGTQIKFVLETPSAAIVDFNRAHKFFRYDEKLVEKQKAAAKKLETLAPFISFPEKRSEGKIPANAATQAASPPSAVSPGAGAAASVPPDLLSTFARIVMSAPENSAPLPEAFHPGMNAIVILRFLLYNTPEAGNIQ